MNPNGAIRQAEALLGCQGKVMLNMVLVVPEFCLLVPNLEVLGEVAGLGLVC